MLHYLAILMLTVISAKSFGQVDDIKNASASKSGDGESRGSGNNSGGVLIVDLIQFSFHGLAEWQRIKLQKKEAIPELVSLEVMAQGASQPSRYYLVHPRIRGNWGLFSSDFRINYLIEDDIDGLKHIRTTDWQVIEFNIVTAHNFNFYVGTGFLYEAFSGGKYFAEWTTAVQFKPASLPLRFQAEYRYSEPRLEASANVQLRIVSTGSLHVYATGGAVFQQYYSSIKVWGMQGGLLMRVF